MAVDWSIVELKRNISDGGVVTARCAIRYEYIEKRLNEGSAKFKRLEMLLWGVYPFMVTIIIGAAKFL
jgi:hypothetical protein